jgi:hypothetical protein
LRLSPFSEKLETGATPVLQIARKPRLKCAIHCLQTLNENHSIFERAGARLVWRWKEQILWVEPWGKDSIRVRATTLAGMPLR